MASACEDAPVRKLLRRLLFLGLALGRRHRGLEEGRRRRSQRAGHAELAEPAGAVPARTCRRDRLPVGRLPGMGRTRRRRRLPGFASGEGEAGSGIFHVPGGQNYERTHADRCYTDPSAAEADGLRRAKRSTADARSGRPATAPAATAGRQRVSDRGAEPASTIEETEAERRR